MNSRLPADIHLEMPRQSDLPEGQQHFLLYIPWEEKYQSNISPDLLPFFQHALPHLHARTTDVHTAICLGFLNEADTVFAINRRVVGLSLILHDCGWSKLSEAEIAQSLGIQGLALTKDALGPKEKHAVEGQKLAQEILESFDFDPPLQPEEIEIILASVRYHDQPELVAGQQNSLPLEVQVLVDLDHLWSFTHENFWQDTLRKGVSPSDYSKNLANDLPNYFVTEWGKQKARTLLAERNQENDNC